MAMTGSCTTENEDENENGYCTNDDDAAAGFQLLNRLFVPSVRGVYTLYTRAATFLLAVKGLTRFLGASGLRRLWAFRL